MLPYLRRYYGSNVVDVLQVQSSTNEARVRFLRTDGSGGYTIGLTSNTAGAGFALQRVAADGLSSNVALSVRPDVGVGVGKPFESLIAGAALDVSGWAVVSSNLAVGKAAPPASALALDVSGSAALSGGVVVGRASAVPPPAGTALDVSGAVAASAGAALGRAVDLTAGVKWSLDVSGASRLAGTAVLSAALAVGKPTAPGANLALDVSGATNLSSTLAVGGVSVFASPVAIQQSAPGIGLALDVSGQAAVSVAFVVGKAGPASPGLALDVSGAVALSGATAVGKASAATGLALDVSGTVALSGATAVGKASAATGLALDVAGQAAVSAALAVGKAAANAGLALDVTGAVALAGPTAIDKPAAYPGIWLDVSGAVALSGPVAVGKQVPLAMLDVAGTGAVSTSLAVGKQTATYGVALDVVGVGAVSSALSVGKAFPAASIALDVSGTSQFSGNVAVGMALPGVNVALDVSGMGVFTQTVSVGRTALMANQGVALDVSGICALTGPVAIGKTSAGPGLALDVSGLAAFSSNVTIGGTATFANAVSFSCNVALSSAASFACSISVGKSGASPGLAVDVSGAAAFSGGVAVGKPSAAAGLALDVSGAAAVSGNFLVGRVLTVQGAGVFSSTVAVAGAATFASPVSMAQGLAVAGNVGFGTTQSAYALDVWDQNGKLCRLVESSSTPAEGATIRCYRAYGSTAAPSGVGTDAALLSLRAWGCTSAGTFPASRTGGIQVCAGETFTPTATGSYIAFETTSNGSTACLERVRVSGTGFVGIGTTAPAYPLDVSGTLRATSVVANGYFAYTLATNYAAVSSAGAWSAGADTVTAVYHPLLHFSPADGRVGSVFNSETGPGTAATSWIDYAVAAGATSCAIATLNWSDAGYADLFGRLSGTTTYVFLLRHNGYNAVSNASSGTVYDGACLIPLAGIALYDRIRVQVRKGRFRCMGVGWSYADRQAHSGTSVGQIHGDNVCWDGTTTVTAADVVANGAFRNSSNVAGLVNSATGSTLVPNQGTFGNWQMTGQNTNNWKGIRFPDGSVIYLMMGNGSDRTTGVWSQDYNEWMFRCDTSRIFYTYNDLHVQGETYINGWFRNNNGGTGLYNQATGSTLMPNQGSYGDWQMSGQHTNNWKGIRFPDWSVLHLMMGNGGDRTTGVWSQDYGDWMFRCDHTRNFYVYGNLTVNGSFNLRNVNFANDGSGLIWGNNYSRIYDNMHLHIETDDNMYISAPAYLEINSPNTTFLGDVYSRNLRVTGGVYIQSVSSLWNWMVGNIGTNLYVVGSAYAYYFAANGFPNVSDVRVKNIVQGAWNDLETLNALTVVRYTHKDPALYANENEHDRAQIGFIAQDLARVLPNAIQTMSHKLPDILAACEVDGAGHWLQLDDPAAAASIRAGDRIAVDDAVLAVLAVDGARVTFAPDAQSEKLKDTKRSSVFGHHVDDFLAIDVNVVLAVAVGAVQQLSAQVDALRSDNLALRAQVGSLADQVAALRLHLGI